MKASEKRDLMMLNSGTLNNFPISNSPELQLFTHLTHDRAHISNDVRIKCATQ